MVKILLHDDGSDQTKLLCMALRRAGIVVLLTPDPDVWDAAAQADPDLMLIDAQKAMDDRLDLIAQARYDALTGALGRRYLIERLIAEQDRCERSRTPLSCVLIDVDYFKRVNDTYGHLAGDQVLQGVVRVLESVCRKYDLLGRIGGEEFVLILPETAIEGAKILAERCRRELELNPILSHRGMVPVTTSFGVAQAFAGEPPDSLISRADEALYRAKNGGRNRVEC